MKIKISKIPLRFSDIVLLAFLGYSMGGSSSSLHLYISIGLLGLWIISALLSDVKAFRIAFQDKKLIWLFLYLLYAFMTGLLVGEFSYEIKQFVAGFYLFSPILILNYYTRKNELDIRRIDAIVICTLAIMLFYSYRAIRFYGQYTAAARYLAMNKEKYGDIAIGGGYALAYGSAILSILLLSMIIERRIDSGAKRIMALGMFFVCSLIVFATQSTVAVVCWAISVVVAIVFSDKRMDRGNVNRIFIKLIVVLIASVAIFFSVEIIGKFIIWVASTQEGTFANRLREVGNMLIGEESFGSGYAFGRFTIPLKSLGTFFTHPLFGVSYKHGNNFLDSSLFGVGQHGEWADALANYGVLFGTLFIAIYVRTVKEVKRINPGISPAWWVCFLLIGLFNPIRTFNANVIIFMVVPMIAVANRES
jgi:hypothetical protein